MISFALESPGFESHTDILSLFLSLILSLLSFFMLFLYIITARQRTLLMKILICDYINCDRLFSQIESIIGVQWDRKILTRGSTVRQASFPTGTVDLRVGIFLSTLNIIDRFFFSHISEYSFPPFKDGSLRGSLNERNKNISAKSNNFVPKCSFCTKCILTLDSFIHK